MTDLDPDLSGGAVIRDQGISRGHSIEDTVSSATDKRFDHMYIGLRLPKRPHRPGKHKHHHHHHHHHHHKDKNSANHIDPVQPTSMTPSEQIQQLIGENDEETHNIFCQMDTLFQHENNFQWREAARWVKYEEDVEEGGERWSKPHVASLSLHSLFELRSSILQGAVILDMDALHIGQIADLLLDNLVNNRLLEDTLRDQIRVVFTSIHAHQHQKRRRSMMPGEENNPAAGFKRRSMKRTFSEIGRSFSMKSKDSAVHLSNRQGGLRGNPNSVPNMESLNGDLHESPSSAKLNQQFMRKIPEGAEAANIMVGEIECLKYQVAAFIRLSESRNIRDMTEVPIPTRFIFILLGPTGSQAKNVEMGRSISTILVDEVFREVAYKARNRQDLLSGIDEFLDQVTVLPPGEWDPKIRIEPPDSVPSQEGRKIAKSPSTAGADGDGQGSKKDDEEEEEISSHADPTLERTGKIFGGLIKDVKRKIPWYPSDFKDCLHIQCFASIIYLFLATLTPNVTFGGLLGLATKQYMGTMECILTAAIVGVLFALFSGQPLNILGSTGPMLVLEMILFNVCEDRNLDYLPFRCWVGIWTTFLVFVIVAFDLSALVRYITRFTEESFASLIAIIFIYEAFKKEIGILSKYPVNTHLGSTECYCGPPIPIINSTNVTSMENLTDISTMSMASMTTSLPGTTDVYQILSDTTTAFGNMTNKTIDWRIFSKHECKEMGGILIGEGCKYQADVFFLSILLFLGTYTIASTFTNMKNGRFFPTFKNVFKRLPRSSPADKMSWSPRLHPRDRDGKNVLSTTIGILIQLTGSLWIENLSALKPQVRQLFSDFAVLSAIIIMVVIDILIGINTPKLEVPAEFAPSKPGRGWFVNPISPKNPWWLCFLAALPALLAVILVFMDQQITAVIVNRKENKLKKGNGYHLDMAVVGVCILICSFLGLPWYVAATVSALAHVMSLKKESECTAPGEKPAFLGVREQRVTALMVGILSGLAVFLTKILSVIPMPVLYGVFLYMGVAALKGMQFMDRLMIIFMPAKYQPDRMYLRHVPIKRVHIFTLIQIICLAILWVIKQVKSISIIFPMMVAGTCFVRKAMDRIFTQQELRWLDDIFPEDKKRAKADKKKNDGEDDEMEKENLLGNDERLNEIKIQHTRGEKYGKHTSFDDRVNISEEMSKTSIWLQVRRDSSRENGSGVEMRANKRRKDRRNKELSEKNEKAAFYFGDEEDGDTLKELPEEH